jgi:hypothetical protein
LLKQEGANVSYAVEGVGSTSAIVLISSAKAPRSINLAGQPVQEFSHAAAEGLLWIRFANEARPRELTIQF